MKSMNFFLTDAFIFLVVVSFKSSMGKCLQENWCSIVTERGLEVFDCDNQFRYAFFSKSKVSHSFSKIQVNIFNLKFYDFLIKLCNRKTVVMENCFILVLEMTLLIVVLTLQSDLKLVSKLVLKKSVAMKKIPDDFDSGHPKIAQNSESVEFCWHHLKNVFITTKYF